LDLTGQGPVDLTGQGPVDLTGQGPVDLTGQGPVDLSGQGPVDLTGQGPVDLTGQSPVDLTGQGPVDLTGQGPVDLTGQGPVDLTGQGPVGTLRRRVRVVKIDVPQDHDILEKDNVTPRRCRVSRHREERFFFLKYEEHEIVELLLEGQELLLLLYAFLSCIFFSLHHITRRSQVCQEKELLIFDVLTLPAHQAALWSPFFTPGGRLCCHPEPNKTKHNINHNF